MCGGVDPRPLLRTWLGVLVVAALIYIAWRLAWP
jgi:hypothetical protein